MKFRLKTITTIVGHTDVEAASRADAVSKMKLDLIRAGYSSPLANCDVKHEIYIKET